MDTILMYKTNNNGKTITVEDLIAKQNPINIEITSHFSLYFQLIK